LLLWVLTSYSQVSLSGKEEQKQQDIDDGASEELEDVEQKDMDQDASEDVSKTIKEEKTLAKPKKKRDKKAENVIKEMNEMKKTKA